MIANPDDPFEPSDVHEVGEVLVSIAERGQFRLYRGERSAELHAAEP